MTDLRCQFAVTFRSCAAIAKRVIANSTKRKTAGLVLALALAAGLTHAQVQTVTCNGGFTPVVAAPPVLLTSLKIVPNPVLPNGPGGAVRADLVEFIANQAAAIQLGKALFWEMQAGSDNKTACATCHFNAGSDTRFRDQINSGPDGSFAPFADANALLTGHDFPFTLKGNADNIAGSQGVRASTFKGFGKSGAELTTTPTGYRQVTGKNAPSVINAVFNHRNFWNGRAQPEFNGVNPFGSRDSSARVWVLGVNGIPALVNIRIDNASLASQAVGPALNTVEMSAAGRTFSDLGHKMLLAKPLALQKVDRTDSVLGALADISAGKGLNTTYAALIKKAFQPKWWNYSKKMPVGSYSMMEQNFSLFWGLSIMLYEATLVSDNSPLDQYLFPAGTAFPRPSLPDTTPLNQVVTRLAAEGVSVSVTDLLKGLALFELPVAPPPNSFPAAPLNLANSQVAPNTGSGLGCTGCHFPGELTSASVRNLTGPGLEIGDTAFKRAGFDLRLERMFMQFPPVPVGSDAITFDPSTYAVAVTDMIINGFPTAVSPPLPVPMAVYDAGWYNVGVRPTVEDLGLGDTLGSLGPLSWTRLFQWLLPGGVDVPGNGLGCPGAGNPTFPNEVLNASGFPLLSGPILGSEATAVDGSFKVPSLRNVELSGPYFHNGGKATLAQVLDFYNMGGDFADPANKAPAIVPLMLSADQESALIAFMVALTDERVRWQTAPFDHPELIVPNGADSSGADITNEFAIPAVGAGGLNASGFPPLLRFLGLSPFER